MQVELTHIRKIPSKMSAICIVCHSKLFITSDHEEFTEEEDHVVMVAKCGHLVHNSCLQEVKDWIDAKASRLKYKNCCPYCRKDVGVNGFFEIFPMFEKVKKISTSGKTSNHDNRSATPLTTRDSNNNSSSEDSNSPSKFQSMRKIRNEERAKAGAKRKQQLEQLQQEHQRRAQESNRNSADEHQKIMEARERERQNDILLAERELWQRQKLSLERDYEYIRNEYERLEQQKKSRGSIERDLKGIQSDKEAARKRLVDHINKRP